MATVKRASPTFWHREATETLRAMLWTRRMTFKELSRALEPFGEHVPEKTLSNKVNRGTFSFQFFLQCMHALGRSEVRFRLEDLSNEEMTAMRNAKKRARRAQPVRRSKLDNPSPAGPPRR